MALATLKNGAIDLEFRPYLYYRDFKTFVESLNKAEGYWQEKATKRLVLQEKGSLSRSDKSRKKSTTRKADFFDENSNRKCNFFRQ